MGVNVGVSVWGVVRVVISIGVSVWGCQCVHVSVGHPPDTPTQTHSSDTYADIHTQTRPHRHIHLTYIQCVSLAVSMGVSV